MKIKRNLRLDRSDICVNEDISDYRWKERHPSALRYSRKNSQVTTHVRRFSPADNPTKQHETRNTLMAVHHGGKVGKAGKTLAKPSSSKGAKSQAGKTLANHKAAQH